MILGKYEVAAGPLGVMNLAICCVRSAAVIWSAHLSLGEHRPAKLESSRNREREYCVPVWTPGPYRLAHRVERLKAESWFQPSASLVVGLNPMRIEWCFRIAVLSPEG